MVTVTRDAHERTFHGAEDLVLFLLNDLALQSSYKPWLETGFWLTYGKYCLACSYFTESAYRDCFSTANAVWEKTT